MKMSADICPLSDELKTIAANELNEVESRLAEDIATFREWILGQPHLKARVNDQFLLAFLRGSKHSLEKAKSKIDHFYTIKTMMPKVFRNFDNDETLDALISSGTVLFPEKPQLQKYVACPDVFITRLCDNFDYNRFKLIDLLRCRSMLVDYALQNNVQCFINGYVEIIDLTKCSLKLYAQTDFVMMKKLSVFTEKALPLRLKGIHIINCPKEGQEILNFVKTFINEKYRKLFFVHKSLEDLHKFVSKDLLPVEYGGTNGTIPENTAHIYDLFTNFKDAIFENEQYGVNERLRTNKEVNERSLFGLEGSFRKLDID